MLPRYAAAGLPHRSSARTSRENGVPAVTVEGATTTSLTADPPTMASEGGSASVTNVPSPARVHGHPEVSLGLLECLRPRAGAAPGAVAVGQYQPLAGLERAAVDHQQDRRHLLHHDGDARVLPVALARSCSPRPLGRGIGGYAQSVSHSVNTRTRPPEVIPRSPTMYVSRWVV